MFDAAAEVGVAAFMAGDSAPSDEVVVADLEHAGVEPWLARRLTVFLPIAFGRRLLDGIGLSDTFVDENGVRRLDDDPVYPWVARRAAQATQAEVERIGLRSSEIHAVNQALRAGISLQNAALGPVALSETLPPAPAGDGGVPSAVTTFEALMATRGFPVTDGRVGELEVGGGVTALRRPAPELVMGRATFAVRHPGLAVGMLVESFTGAGATWREALGEGVAKFENSALPPIIAGLVDRSATGVRVRWQRWEHPQGAFDVCLGPQLVVVDGQAPVPDLTDVLEGLRAALGRAALSREIHTLRIMISYNRGGILATGVLLDGEDWTDGETVADTAPEPGYPGPMEVQQYALLLPA